MPSKISSKLIADLHDGNVIIAYQGTFDNSVLTILAQNIEANVYTDEKLKKKLFKIFLELAQNVSLYSAERNSSDMGEGIFIIKEYEDYFTIATGNMVPNNVVNQMIEHITKINKLDRPALREYKRERRGMPHGIKGGANIGLIQVSLTSENNLNYLVGEKQEESTFIAIATKINK